MKKKVISFIVIAFLIFVTFGNSLIYANANPIVTDSDYRLRVYYEVDTQPLYGYLPGSSYFEGNGHFALLAVPNVVKTYTDSGWYPDDEYNLIVVSDNMFNYHDADNDDIRGARKNSAGVYVGTLFCSMSASDVFFPIIDLNYLVYDDFSGIIDIDQIHFDYFVDNPDAVDLFDPNQYVDWSKVDRAYFSNVEYEAAKNPVIEPTDPEPSDPDPTDPVIPEVPDDEKQDEFNALLIMEGASIFGALMCLGMFLTFSR